MAQIQKITAIPRLIVAPRKTAETAVFFFEAFSFSTNVRLTYAGIRPMAQGEKKEKNPAIIARTISLKMFIARF